MASRLLRLAPLLASVGPAQAWVTETQSRHGTTIEYIRNESLGRVVTGGTPEQSLGLLWTQPEFLGDDTGLGGSITWAWDPALCDKMLPKFNEDFWFFSLINCDSVKASVLRALHTWEANSRHIKFHDVSAKCEATLTSDGVCPAAEIIFTLNASEPVTFYTPPARTVRTEVMSVNFRYTNGLEPVRGFGDKAAAAEAAMAAGSPEGLGYFTAKRPVPAVVGASVIYRTEDVCWYADSQFCGPMHDWKHSWRNPDTAYVAGVTTFFLIWICVVISVVYDFGMSFKRTTRMHQKLLREGGDDPKEPKEEDDAARNWRERKEALCGVVATLSLRGITLRLFLIMVPWAYFTAVFRSCWQCYDFEAATAQQIGHILGLGTPDRVPATVNQYHAGFAAGAAAMVNASTCPGDLWADVWPGVPADAAIDPLTNVRPSIMQAFSLHTPRSCLELDDLEALNVLYPDCEGAPTTPVCAKPALNLGWLRLIVFAGGPLFVSIMIASFTMSVAMTIGEQTGAAEAAAKAEEAAVTADKPGLTDWRKSVA